MKKILGIALVLALAVMLMPSAVFAADPPPTTVDVIWGGGSVDAGGYPVNYGAGWISGTVAPPSATTTFQSGGDQIMGRYKAAYKPGAGDLGNANIYTTSLEASVVDGTIAFDTVREAYGYLNSKPAPGGEESYSFIGTGYFDAGNNWVPMSGSASMAMRSETWDYKALWTGGNDNIVDNTYSTGEKALTFLHNFSASGVYTMTDVMNASSGAFAQVQAVGNGTALLDCGASSASQDTATVAYLSGSNYGWNQDFNATGSGTFLVGGVGNTEVLKYAGFTTSSGYTVVSPGPVVTDGTGIHSYGNGTTMGSANLALTNSFVSGWSISNFSLKAK
jgi:hypothetical protein